MPKISNKDIMEVEVRIPPTPLQIQFVNIAHMFENTRDRQDQSTEDITGLFDSLMAKAFRGELRVETDDREAMGDQSDLGNYMG